MQALDDDREAELIAHPLKYKMWHHSFDPHTEVPVLAEASLKAPPATVRSANVNEVLGKSSMPALVQAAMAKAQSDAARKPTEEEQIAQKSEAELAHEAKLQELSK